jgi:hypothetical protein
MLDTEKLNAITMTSRRKREVSHLDRGRYQVELKIED